MNDTSTTAAVEVEELTAKEFQALLFMTRYPDFYTDKTRRLMYALHTSRMSRASNKWLVEMSDEDVETAVFLIEGYCLNQPKDYARLHNRLSVFSERFRKAFAEFVKPDAE